VKVFYDVFKDVEPLSDSILTLQEESYDNDSDELEWDDFMDDDNIPNISASIMDMSSFDFDMGNIDVEDDIIPPAIEDALQHVCYT
jgi:Zn-dependent M32 family carboxypeptidase